MNCKMLFFIGVAIKIAVSNKLVYNVSAFFPIKWSASKDVLEGFALDFALFCFTDPFEICNDWHFFMSRILVLDNIIL